MFSQPAKPHPTQTLFHELIPTNPSPEFEVLRAEKSVLFKNFIIMFTHSSQPGKARELLVFDIEKLTWSKAAPTGTSKLLETNGSFTACLFNQDKVITFGGYEERGTGGGLFGSRMKKMGCLGSFELTSSNGILAHWSNIECTGPLFYIKGHTANIVGEKMFVFGGQDDKGTFTNDLQVFNLANIESKVSSEVIAPTESSGFMPVPRSKHSSAAVGGKIYIFGGEDAQGVSLNDLWALDLSSLRWNKLNGAGIIPSCRMGASLQAVEGKLLLFGGKGTSDLFSPSYSDFNAYKIDSNTWEAILPDNQAPFGGVLHTFEIYNDKLIAGYESKFYAYQLDGEYKPIVGATGVSQTEKQRVKESLKKLYEEKAYPDVTFRIQGEDIPAHKGILAVRCPHFNKTFTSGMVESTSDVIEVRSMKSETFKSLLEYIYCSEATLNEELAKDLFNVSEEYSLPGLKELCERFLMKHLRVDNIIEIADIVKIFEAKLLEKSVLNFLRQNIEEVYEKEDLQRLPGSILFQLIKK